MVDLGISVVTVNIDKDTIERFKHYVSNTKLKVKIECIEEDAYTIYKGEKFFNRNKAHNSGIKRLKDSKVILCADVDIIAAPGVIEKTYHRGQKWAFFGIARMLPEKAKIKNESWDKWMRLRPHVEGYGGWIAMTPKNWKLAGGWNESMFSWGYDRHIFHRVQNAGIDIERTSDLPIMHVWHKRRNKDIRKINPSLINSLGFESYL